MEGLYPSTQGRDGREQEPSVRNRGGLGERAQPLQGRALELCVTPTPALCPSLDPRRYGVKLDGCARPRFLGHRMTGPGS